MKSIYFLSLLIMSVSACASEVSVGRYTIVETVASNVQRFPLIEIRSVSVPISITTNRDAVDFLLMRTGYRQASDLVRSAEDKSLMHKPLALSNREFANLTILEMLTIVGGLGYVPIIDPINRLVAFEAVYDFEQK